MRYRLRTLLILLAVGPPAIAGVWLAVQSETGFLCLAIVLYVVLGVCIGPRIRTVEFD
jgi:hypothetical protein